MADEFVLAHPDAHTEPKTTVTVLGGMALYLVGNTLFKWAIAGRLPVSLLVGILVLALLIPASAVLT